MPISSVGRTVSYVVNVVKRNESERRVKVIVREMATVTKWGDVSMWKWECSSRKE